MTQTVPNGYTLRAPQAEEVEAVGQLYEAYDVHHFGKAEYSTKDVSRDWEHLDLSTDAWVVTAPDGQVVGYGQANDKGTARFEGVFLVHPDHFGQGIEECLIAKFEAHSRRVAKEQGYESCRVALHADGAIEREKTHIEQAGLEPKFYWLQMLVEMKEAPPAPIWPAGLTIRSFESDEDIRLAFDARTEVFKDQRDGATMTDYEQFAEYMRSPSADKTLNWLVLDGDEVVAFNLCGFRTGMGKISTLGVKSNWRGHGLGLALLHLAFGEFYHRGYDKVIVTVDGENPTGATRLYRRAGMHQIKEYIRYEKEMTSKQTDSITGK